MALRSQPHESSIDDPKPRKRARISCPCWNGPRRWSNLLELLRKAGFQGRHCGPDPLQDVRPGRQPSLGRGHRPRGAVAGGDADAVAELLQVPGIDVNAVGGASGMMPHPSSVQHARRRGRDQGASQGGRHCRQQGRLLWAHPAPARSGPRAHRGGSPPPLQQGAGRERVGFQGPDRAHVCGQARLRGSGGEARCKGGTRPASATMRVTRRSATRARRARSTWCRLLKVRGIDLFVSTLRGTALQMAIRNRHAEVRALRGRDGQRGGGVGQRIRQRGGAQAARPRQGPQRAAEKHKIKMETERRELEALRMLVPKAKKKDLPKYREQGVLDILLKGLAASDAVCA